MTVDLNTDVHLGDYVVLDPTGRDDPDCYEVGRVLSRYLSSQGADGHEEREEDGPYLRVRLNSGEVVGGVTSVASIARANERLCRFCGEGVTATDPDIDYCGLCFYSGRTRAEDASDVIAVLRDAFPDELVEVWHTGGGCFSIAVQWSDGAYAMLAADADVTTHVDEPLEAWYFRDELDEEGSEVASCATLADVIPKLKLVRSFAVSD